jgi:hypothetical protein
MSDAKPVRPPQVTVAGWMVVAGSVLVVLTAFSTVGDIRSLQTREAIEKYLSEPPGDALGVSVQGVQLMLRVAAMVAAASAAATAILGWSALQRSKPARVALTALAVPLFVSGLVSGGIMAAVVCAAIVMLWFQPARDWFDGRTPAPRETAPVRPPVPTARSGGPTTPWSHLPPPAQAPLYPTGPAPRAAVPTTRPGAVSTACVLTWLGCSSAVVMMLLTLAVVLSDPQRLLDEARKQNPDLAGQGITDDLLTTSLVVLAVLLVVWAVGAATLAVLAWRQVRWAWIGLAVSAGAAALLCLVVLVGSVLMVVPMAVCAGSVALLLRPEVRRWYAGPRV